MLAFLLISAGLLFNSVKSSMSKDGRVLLYSDGSRTGDELIEELQQQPYDGISFMAAADEESLRDSVMRGDTGTGIIFTGRLDELAGNEASESRSLQELMNEECIRIYQNSSQMGEFSIKELIYPYVARKLSPAILRQFLTENGITEEAAAIESEAYKEKLKGMSISICQVEEIPGGSSSLEYYIGLIELGFILLMCVLVFIISLTGELVENRSFYRSLNKKRAALLLVEAALVQTLMLMLILMISSAVYHI